MYNPSLYSLADNNPFPYMYVCTVINCTRFGITGEERVLRNGSAIRSPPHHTQCLSCMFSSRDSIEIEFDPHDAFTEEKLVYRDKNMLYKELFMCFVPNGKMTTLRILLINDTSQNTDHTLILTVSVCDPGPGKLIVILQFALGTQ